MLSEKDINLIDRIIRKERLSSEERSYLTKVQNEPFFIEEMDFRKDLHLSLGVHGRNKLREEMISIENGFSRRKLFVIAASLILILTALIIFYPFDQGHKLVNEEIYATYFKPYPNTVAPLVKGENGAENGYIAYEKGNFAEAKEILLGENTITSLFFLGMIAMVEKEYIEAIQYFESVRNDDNTEFHEQAEWYGALSYLATNQEEELKNRLEIMAMNPAHFYSEKSQELLTKLTE